MSIMITLSPKTIVRSHAKPSPLLRSMLLLAGMYSVMFLSPEEASAAYHQWDITEVYSSADGSVQFIELTAQGGSQEFFHSFGGDPRIRSTNSTGTSTFPISADLPGDTFNKTCILGTANLATIPGGVVPDFIIPANFIRPPTPGSSAAVIYDPNSFAPAVFTNLPANGDSSLVRSGGNMVVSPTNSPKNFNNESNSIVPVKIQSISQSGSDFTLSFATATGPNGTAGPGYGVQYNNSLTSTNWTTLTNVTGVGAITNVADASPPDPQRFYRLRVP